MNTDSDGVRDEDIAAALWALDWADDWSLAREHEREGYLRKAPDLRFFLKDLGLKVVPI